MSRIAVVGVLAAIVSCGQSEPEAQHEPDITVYAAEKIVTMDTAMPAAKLVAVHDGRILGVAQSIDDLSAMLDDADFVVDEQFHDKILMPGLIDPHIHPMMAFLLPMHFITPEGWELPSGASAPSRTPENYRTRLAAAINAHEGDTPFFTWGYHELWHGPIDRAALDAIENEKPVIVWQRSFHEIILNTPAMTLLGLEEREAFDATIKAAHAEPDHANFEKGHFFETGLLAAMPGLQPYILAPEWLGAGFAEMKQMMRANGVTMIADMATGLFAGFEQEQKILGNAFGAASNTPARLMLVPAAQTLTARQGSIESAVKFVVEEQARDQAGPVFVKNRVKLFADGAFFSQYMQMGPPGYDDGHEGKWITEPNAFEAQARAFWNAGVDIHWHVNGDAGLDAVLDTIEKLQSENPQAGHRLTLEHLGFSREDQNQRIADLGLLVSAQPNYLYVLGDKYAERGLGVERASHMSRLGSLEDKGVTIALHSDLTMAPVDPMFLAWIAANRVTMDGTEMALDERLTLDKAMRAITIDAAYVLGLEDEIGSIAPGKRADFAVLEDDPYEVGASRLKDIGVWGVIFDGEAYPAAQ